MTLTTNTTNKFMNDLDYSMIIDLGFPGYQANFTYYPNGTIIALIRYTENLDTE